MRAKKVNMNSIQKDWPDLIDLLKNGEEIILTEYNRPVAKISPIQYKKVKTNLDETKSHELFSNKKIEINTASEIWLG